MASGFGNSKETYYPFGRGGGSGGGVANIIRPLLVEILLLFHWWVHVPACKGQCKIEHDIPYSG